MAACGGGGSDAADQASASAVDAGRATAQARRKPPPPPPAPVTDATLALALASASGQATEGNTCGVWAGGSKVLLTSRVIVRKAALAGRSSEILTDAVTLRCSGAT